MTHRKDRRPEGEKFGALVRVLREERRLTQDQLAERAGVSSTYLGFIERGDNVPTLTILLQIASALELKASDLLRDF